MLAEIVRYVRQYVCVTEKQLMRAFHLEASALDPMIELLVQKKILMRERGTQCGRCAESCSSRSLIRGYHLPG